MDPVIETAPNKHKVAGWVNLIIGIIFGVAWLASLLPFILLLIYASFGRGTLPLSDTIFFLSWFFIPPTSSALFIISSYGYFNDRQWRKKTELFSIISALLLPMIIISMLVITATDINSTDKAIERCQAMGNRDSNLSEQDACYYALGMKKDDHNICYKIVTEDLMNQCLMQTNE